MTPDAQPPRGNLRQVRILLWLLVALAVIGTAGFLLWPQRTVPVQSTGTATLGGPFSLTGGDGKPFSSATLAGKPYAI